MQKNRMKVSVITTERNEVDTIEDFIYGILRQSYEFDELVICDGNSNDGTIDLIKKVSKVNSKVKLIIKAGNRSVGRNEAIKQSKSNIIAVTDVGTIADKDWLKYLIEPFEKNPDTAVVGGFFKIKPETLFEETSATQMLSDHDRIDPKTWLPSSRSIAFKKEAWLKVGGYPEYTKYNEDTPFDIALKEAGYNFAFAQKAIVYWRPRPNLKEFFKQYYAYATGDGLDLIHWQNYTRTMLVYLFGIMSVILGYWPITLGLALLYFIRRGRRVIRKIHSIRGWLISPIVTVTKDLADILGFLKGMALRVVGYQKIMHR